MEWGTEMRLTINANLDNDAFAEGGVDEVIMMLTQALDTLKANNDSELAPGIMVRLWDANGNRVGYLSVED